ncbi:PepSY-associated TM helix domain-containing protein [Arundinibacter roseus]|uniref:PepSY domain-containing protein n=1 Tax=Arundinibacter roseus TaxID=2070510 RepID=A0A4R4KLB7_9BACT|nr:PepSY-associated TM helix domain-containing protein [Arundinibacter roseus]TDB67519.1 PepSY domain-containing protein [Arundinibacter roseus]
MASKETAATGRWPKIRKFLNDIHLYLGLASGLVVFVVCLSGTIYVFNTEIREMATPELYSVVQPVPGQNPLPLEELLPKVQQATGGKVLSVKIPADPQRAYLLMVKEKEEKGEKEGRSEKAGKEERGQNLQTDKKEQQAFLNEKPETGKNQKAKGAEAEKAGPGGKAPEGRRPSGKSYMVNPYTAEVLGDARAETSASKFMQTMFSLHRWLLLDKIEEPIFGEMPNRTLGSIITGVCTILFTLGVITGIFIWFPQRLKSWKQGLSIKWSGSWKRTNHDLHNTLGFYSCILLFIMGVTGPFFSFEWYRNGLRKSLGTYVAADAPKPEAPVSQLPMNASENQPVSWYSFLQTIDQTLPYEGDVTLSLPADSAAAMMVRKNKTGFFAPAAADQLYLDQYTGKVLLVERFKDKPFNERVSASIKSLHLGDVYGMFSKILYFLACLIATSLPVTGTLIWINKMKKKPGKKSKSKQPAQVYS